MAAAAMIMGKMIKKNCWRDPSYKILSFPNLLLVSGFIIKSINFEWKRQQELLTA
jgi:hypothetical protein